VVKFKIKKVENAQYNEDINVINQISKIDLKKAKKKIKKDPEEESRKLKQNALNFEAKEAEIERVKNEKMANEAFNAALICQNKKDSNSHFLEEFYKEKYLIEQENSQLEKELEQENLKKLEKLRKSSSVELFESHNYNIDIHENRQEMPNNNKIKYFNKPLQKDN